MMLIAFGARDAGSARRNALTTVGISCQRSNSGANSAPASFGFAPSPLSDWLAAGPSAGGTSSAQAGGLTRRHDNIHARPHESRA